MEWKIALPANAAPEPLPDAPHHRAATAKVPSRERADSPMSSWLGRHYVDSLTDADLAVLENSVARLGRSRVNDDALWRAVPDVEAVAQAEKAISAYEELRAGAAERREAERMLMEGFGFDPSVPPASNAAAADDMAERYAAVAEQIGQAADAIMECAIAASPNLADILFLSDIFPSLAAADVDLIESCPVPGGALTIAAEAAASMSETAALVHAATGFDPSAHALETLSGIRRAILTRRASDFVKAFSMFGVSFSSSEKALKASALMKKYLMDADAFDVAAGETPRHRAAMRARLDLDVSISRRAAILADERISRGLTALAAGDHVARIARMAKSLGADARQIVEGNIEDAAPPPPAAGLVEHLLGTAKELQEWAGRVRSDIEAVGGAPESHPALQEAVDEAGREMTTLGDFSISGPEDVERIERHVSWLREATLLPLSDEALGALLRLHGKVDVPGQL